MHAANNACSEMVYHMDPLLMGLQVHKEPSLSYGMLWSVYVLYSMLSRYDLRYGVTGVVGMRS
jgi:hypothetical protein